MYARSRGVPRLVNVISDAILLVGYGDERPVVDLALAREAMEELEATGVLDPETPRAAAAVTIPAHAAATSPAIAARQPAAPRAQPPAVRAQPASGLDELREAGLREREASVSERERALAEQRRVLAEQFRLQRSADYTAATPAVGTGSWPPVPVTHPLSPAHRQMVSPFDAEPRGLWARLRRAFAGPAAALDERS